MKETHHFSWISLILKFEQYIENGIQNKFLGASVDVNLFSSSDRSEAEAKSTPILLLTSCIIYHNGPLIRCHTAENDGIVHYNERRIKHPDTHLRAKTATYFCVQWMYLKNLNNLHAKWSFQRVYKTMAHLVCTRNSSK